MRNIICSYFALRGSAIREGLEKDTGLRKRGVPTKDLPVTSRRFDLLKDLDPGHPASLLVFFQMRNMICCYFVLRGLAMRITERLSAWINTSSDG